MSINITVHGNKLENVTRKTILTDPEYAKKEQLADRRKQRLEQVRQQSKEVAQQVRKNVSDEMKRQEKRIEDQKHKELLEWREKALAEAREQRCKGLDAVGTAHRAALNERESEAIFSKEQQLRNDIAKQRGKDALLKEKSKTVPTKTPLKAKNKSLTPKRIKSNKTAKSTNTPSRPTARHRSTDVAEISNDSSSEEEATSTTSTSLKQNKTVHMDINTDSDDSTTSISLMDSHDESNRHFYRTSNKSIPSEITKSSYNAHDYLQNDTSASDKSNSIEQSKPKKFTKISDLIQKRQPKMTSISTLDIPGSTEVSIAPAKSCLKTNPQQESVIVSKDITPAARKGTVTTKQRSEISNSVQFYDYNNKFSKEYEQRQEFVKTINKSDARMNAMESARLELQLQKDLKERAEERRRKAEERHKTALEKEKLQKQCEILNQQLNALNRDYGILNEIDGREGVNVFIKTRPDSETKTQTKKQERVIEGLSEKPERVPCSKLVRKQEQHEDNIKKVSKPIQLADDDNLSESQINCYSNTVSSSDSSTSQLLGSINKQSEQVSQDIEKCENSTTLKKLLCLLEKINLLRDQIMNKIEKCKIRNDKDSTDVNDLTHRINELRKERENILAEEKENIECLKKDLAKREKRLKEKEKSLNSKIQKIIDFQSPTKKRVLDDDTSEKDEKTKQTKDRTPSSVPIEIVIKLKNETWSKHGKSPRNTPRKRSSLISDFKHPKRKKVALVKHAPESSDNQAKDDEKQKSDDVRKVVDISPAKSRTSTSYMSLPEAVHTQLGKFLSVPAVKHMPEEKASPIVEAGTSSDIQPKSSDKSKKNLNPVLTHYIQRLLGMSRSSIDMLGVSSSEIETPSSSLIANSANLSSSDSIAIQNARLQRLQEFINENYSLINELEESIRSSKSSNSSRSSSKEVTEKIWRKALRKEFKDANAREKTELHLEKQYKSILKNKSEPKNALVKRPSTPRHKVSVETQVSDVSKSEKSVEVKLPIQVDRPVEELLPVPHSGTVTKASDSIQLVDKYTELTQNCTKRIAELTDMINQVRKEKQKILEITLTSGSDTARNSTEYLELPEGHIVKSDDDSSRILDLKKVLDAQIDSDRVNLEKNKLTGVSRDSGISLSRPVTALDSPDGVEGRAIEKFISEHPNDNRLKEISKLTKLHATVPADPNSTARKQPKPPVTINRYSPQLIEERVHELSTILEVETPATSRINASIAEKGLPTLEDQISDSIEKIKQFQTFEEYITKNNLDVSQFLDFDSNSKMQINFDKLAEMLDKGKLDFREFPSFNTYLRKKDENSSDLILENTELSQQLLDDRENLSYKRFPSHKSYVKQLGVSDLMDSQTIAAVSITDTSDKPEDTEESTESLPDVVAELKKRNILKHSFRNDAPVSNLKILSSESTSTSSESENRVQIVLPGKLTPIGTSIKNSSSNSKSPVKENAPTQRVRENDPTFQKTSQKGIDVNLTGIEKLPSTTTSSSGGSESLGKELSEMGLKWASLMLKKSQQSMELGSTSSSFTYEPNRRKSPKKSPEKGKVSGVVERDHIDKESGRSRYAAQQSSKQSSLESIGKAFNLKEFFAKELQKRLMASSSLSSTDDSLASQFIKSLLGTTHSSHSTPTPTSGGKVTSERQRHHTSTPVNQKRSSPSSKSTEDASKLFSGESCISSVRLSTEMPHRTQINLADRDALNIPHLNLDINVRRKRPTNKDRNDDNNSS